MRNVLALFSSSLLASMLLLASCSKPSTKKEESFSQPSAEIDLDSIRKRGYINVLVDNNSISYFIYKGHPMGYDYELLRLYAEYLGVSLRPIITSGIGSAIERLNRGEGDIMAFPLTITKERKRFVSFTRPHFNSYQVLVQRKPKNWRKMSVDQINDSLIRNPADLIGREVYVLKHSSFANRLNHLSDEIGGDIIIREDSANAASESLIKKVAMGEIDLTVADHAIAAVNAAYYPNIDINTVISLPQQIAWATRKNSPELLESLNDWLKDIKRKPTFMVIFNRYYKSPRTSRMRMRSVYSSMGGNKLSPYDKEIKAAARTLNWDWRLLAAVIYQESRFRVDDESWAGAKGLMQLMPETAKRFGADNPSDPYQSIRAGTRYLKYLDKYWSRSISDPDQRVKFVLASYNAGLSHIIDARKLAIKYGEDPTVWEDSVVEYLLKKSDPQYFKDPKVKAGYCKCEEPVNYVHNVLERYHEYRIHIAG